MAVCHLCCQLLHVGVEFIEQIEALLKERVLGVHVRQHLQRREEEEEISQRNESSV